MFITFRELMYESWYSTEDPARMASIMLKFFPVMMTVYVLAFCIYLAWSHAIGIYLYKKLPASVTMPVRTFKAFTIICSIVMFIGPAIMYYFIQNTIEMVHHTEMDFLPANMFFTVLVLIPIQLFFAFCLFFRFYFVAKCFKAVQKQKEVTFSDYVGEFFLMWFYFVGVWLIQPRINEMAAEDGV